MIQTQVEPLLEPYFYNEWSDSQQNNALSRYGTPIIFTKSKEKVRAEWEAIKTQEPENFNAEKFDNEAFKKMMETYLEESETANSKIDDQSTR